MTHCPHCQASIGRRTADGRMLVRVQNRTLVVHDDGRVEINCGECKRAMPLPLRPKSAGRIIRVGPLRIRSSEE